MSSQPALTFQSNVSPFPTLSTITYQFTKDTYVFPVLNGENSDTQLFRVFNNWALASNVATAENVNITTYDGVGPASNTASTSPVSQLWIHMLENMFGESTPSTNYTYTNYFGFDTPVGGTSNVYTPEQGSSGTVYPLIRAGSSGSGWGFIEFKTYASLPQGVTAQQYLFGVVINYSWVS